VIATAGLIASAAASDIGKLIAVALKVGAASVVARVLITMAASRAGAGHRGRVVGTFVGGLLLGILLRTTVSSAPPSNCSRPSRSFIAALSSASSWPSRPV
jgi:hypothetical protein